MKKKYFIVVLTIVSIFKISSQELIIGEERLDPGIKFIFEGAIKDKVFPLSRNLIESETNVHIEARVNWDISNVPKGTPKGGFIPYLKIISIIKNQSSGIKTFIDLFPHINLIDNFHYARNISLPGSINDLYTVQFLVNPPSESEFFFHNDWIENYGENIFNKVNYIYTDVDFEEIANSSRK